MTWPPIFVGAFFTAAGFGLRWIANREETRARRVLDQWMRVPATITWSQVEKLGFLDQAAEDRKSVGRMQIVDNGERPQQWKARIRFTYARGGEIVESDRVTLHAERRKKQVDTLVAAYPYGARAHASINPLDLDDVVLAPEATVGISREGAWLLWVVIGAGVLAMVAGLAGLGEAV